MKRLFVVYNPRSSRYSDVRKEILDKLPSLNGFIVGKYEVQHTNIDDNIKTFSKLLKDGDLIISAGGDATGVICANAILKSGKDAALAVLPYGNFNDLSRTLGTKTLEDIFSSKDQGFFLEKISEPAKARVSTPRLRRRTEATQPERKEPGLQYQKLYPLEIYVDGKFFRYATCYVTIGMMGEAVKLYDTKKMRQKLKTNFGRKITSYTALAGWYFKNRHKKVFLPDFKQNGKQQPSKTSDYAAVNGRFMARVMKGGEDYLNPTTFRSETDHLTSLWRLLKLMIKSILHRVPGTPTSSDTLDFIKPATVELQAEGEYQVFKDIRQIIIKKSSKCLKVIHK